MGDTTFTGDQRISVHLRDSSNWELVIEKVIFSIFNSGISLNGVFSFCDFSALSLLQTVIFFAHIADLSELAFLLYCCIVVLCVDFFARQLLSHLIYHPGPRISVNRRLAINLALKMFF